MSRFWGYSKRPKNWHKLLKEELTDEELNEAVIVAKYKTTKESLPPDKTEIPEEKPPQAEKPKIEKPKISATVIRPDSSTSY